MEGDANQFIEKLRLGLSQAYWPGRYEVVAESGQIWDGAHNPHGARALRFSLEDMFAAKSFVFIFACFQNKDLESLLTQLVRPGDYVLAPHLAGERPFHRFAQIEAVCKRLGVHCLPFDDFAAASRHARVLLEEGGGQFGQMAVVTGSFATIREAKALGKAISRDLG